MQIDVDNSFQYSICKIILYRKIPKCILTKNKNVFDKEKASKGLLILQIV